MSERVPAGGPFRAAVGLHERLSLEHLNEARRILSSYCSSGSEYCCFVVDVLSRIAPLVARARLFDLSRDEKYEGLDKDVIGVFRMLEDLYGRYISGSLLLYDEDIIIKIKEKINIYNKTFYPGEYVRLPPGKAISLILADLAEPSEATAIKIAKTCSKVEGVEESEVPEKD